MRQARQAMNAISDANDCITHGQFDTARQLLAEARKLINEPVSGQEAHLARAVDSLNREKAA